MDLFTSDPTAALRSIPDAADAANPPDAAGAPGRGAYLVLQSAGRWSDVFRLTVPKSQSSASPSAAGQPVAVIGRSSSNQIVLRSERASRRHAAIRWDAGDQNADDQNAFNQNANAANTGWVIEDLGSRNGTMVGGKRIEGPTRLRDGDVIDVAGFAITFAHQIGGVGSSAGDGRNTSSSAQATDDQITMELDPASITDRRGQSRYLHEPIASSESSTGGASLRLLKLAFELARQPDSIAAMEFVLDAIAQHASIDTAGGYLVEKSNLQTKRVASADVPLVATRQTGSRSYRRPPESLLAMVTADDGQATLARNVVGDGELATENSRGEIDVESLILSPVRSHDKTLFGWLHLTTTAGAMPLGSSDLEFVVAACEILAESLVNQTQREQLGKALHQSRRTIATLQHQLGDRVRLIGRSDAMASVIEQITLAAPTGATVLVRGESGVGKELVASAMHHASDRRDGPMVCLNCAALSPTLLESELFGHEKGAFTGATERKRGKFEAADGGTLMLDEIGEMSPDIQAKFLRVLEGHPFERVGGHEPIKVDVRVVAATNRDLAAMVRDGGFRQDLFYRLNVVEIVVPPLRHRGGDVMLLANFFLDRFNKEMGRKIESITDAAKKKLQSHDWPGNIRELKNVIERAVVLNRKTVIDESDLAITTASISPSSTEEEAAIEITLAELEQLHIERVLRFTDGNKSRAATILGIERSTLDRKLKRYAGE